MYGSLFLVVVVLVCYQNLSFVECASWLQKTKTKSTNSSTDIPITPYVGSRIAVHIPISLHKQDGYEHERSDFGFSSSTTSPTQSRGSIQSYLYYIDDSLCEPLITTPPTMVGPTTNDTLTTLDLVVVYPITNTSSTKQGTTNKYNFKTPFALLINSNNGGQCSSVVQVRNGQSLGASVVLIGADFCRCSDTACTRSYSDRGNSADSSICSELPIPNHQRLVNDGSAGDISIPSFLLHRLGFDEIRTTMRNNVQQALLMEVTWGLAPIATNNIEQDPLIVHVWTSSYNSIADTDFLDEMKLIDQSFYPSQAIFVPHYYILDGTRFGCYSGNSNGNDHSNNNVNPTFCDQLCTNNGRYCTIHPHNKALTGKMIIKESIRQLCIFSLYADPDIDTGVGDTDMYWDYVRYHQEHCAKGELFDNEQCIIDAYKYSKIPYDKKTKTYKDIEKCMVEDASNLDDDVPNDVLEDQLSYIDIHGIYQIPSLGIDKHTLGNGVQTSTSNLFIEICNHYTSTFLPMKHYPWICDDCAACPNVIGCLEEEKCVDFVLHNHNHERPFDFRDFNDYFPHTTTFSWFTIIFLFVSTTFISMYMYSKGRIPSFIVRRFPMLDRHTAPLLRNDYQDLQLQPNVMSDE